MNAPVRHPVVPFDPPSLQLVERVTALGNYYFRPQFIGLEHVHAGQPALYVSNHTIFGSLDSPLLYRKLFMDKGIVLRSLGDHVHFDIPFWRDVLIKGGAVPGTPENCTQLMQAGEHILVYPGGGREVAKRKGEQYKLTWKTRTGFARMAIQHQYPIIPVAALGADEAYDVVIDAYDVMRNPLGRWLLNRPAIRAQTRNGDVLMPIVKGIGPTLIPRPEKFWFSFGKPISPAAFIGKEQDKEQVWQLRKQVMEAIENGLDELRALRARDKDISPLRKWLTRKPASSAST